MFSLLIRFVQTSLLRSANSDRKWNCSWNWWLGRL